MRRECDPDVSRPPRQLERVGNCPSCGAPIYFDEAALKRGDQTDGPMFTCRCRAKGAVNKAPEQLTHPRALGQENLLGYSGRTPWWVDEIDRGYL